MTKRIDKEYNIYCPECEKYQSFTTTLPGGWTDLICNSCRVVIATIRRKGGEDK